MDEIKNVFGLFGPQVPIIQRIINLSILIGLMIYVDYVTGFSEHYNRQRQIEEITKYSEILKTSSIQGRDSLFNLLVNKKRLELLGSWDSLKMTVYTSVYIPVWQIILSGSWLFICMMALGPKILKDDYRVMTARQYSFHFAGYLMIFIIPAVIVCLIGAFVAKHTENSFTVFAINTLLQLIIVGTIIIASINYSERNKIRRP